MIPILPLLNRFILVLVFGLLVFVAADRGSSPSLAMEAESMTAEEITRCLAVYERYGELMPLRISEKSGQSDEKENFLTVMGKVEEIIERTEKEACLELGFDPQRYREILRRLLAVQAWYQYSELKNDLVADLEKRKGMSEEEYREEASAAFQETEAWFAGFQEKLDATRKKRDEDVKKYIDGLGDGEKPDPRVIESYDRPVELIDQQIASYDEIIMQPVNDSKESGEWIDSMKIANERKMEELTGTIGMLESFLSRGRLVVGARDAELVGKVVDRDRLDAIRPSRPGDSPSPEEID